MALFSRHSGTVFVWVERSSPQKLPELPKLSQHLQQPHQPQAPHQPAPGAPPAPGASPEAPKGDAKPIQTPEELTFHATNDLYLTVMAVLFFPPLGLLAVFFCHKVKQCLSLFCPLPTPCICTCLGTWVGFSLSDHRSPALPQGCHRLDSETHL